MAELFHIARAETSDAAARQQALDIDRSWIVEAPAGSGKTGLLIQRYLRLLGDPNVTEPDQVLAITFTKAATAEIRDRVVRELQRAQNNVESGTEYERATRAVATTVLARDRALGWRLLDEPRQLRVRTIDSVCAEIARSLPLLSEGSGTLTPVEEPSQLHREAARRTWLHLGGADVPLSQALRDLLLHRDGDLDACITLIAEMLSQREQWGPLIPLREEDLSDDALETDIKEQLDQTLEQVICEGLGRLVKAFPDNILRHLTSLANSLSGRPGYRNQPSPFAICHDLWASPTAAANHLPYWRALIHLLIAPSKGTWRSGLNKNHLLVELTSKERAALKELLSELQTRPELLDLLGEVGSLPPVRFPAEQWPITKALLRVLRQALTELQLVFTDAGRCDFVEPALMARYALSRKPRLETQDTANLTNLQHLLVDEMQDTSVRQYELLERLTDGWASERKTVFLVGDPKQSIYLFRHARVDRFIETMRTGMLGNVPVGLLQLTANFRSQAGLISAFNQDFSRIFPEEISRPDDVSYVSGAATREKTPGLAGEAGAAWHLNLLPGDSPTPKQDAQRQRRVDARRIRQIVQSWQARPLPEGRTSPWKIAILVQSRASLASVLSEFQHEPSVALRALKIDALNERTEVLDLLALTRALLHPADRTAWLAVLHAPWCGLGLSDLHILTGQDDDRFLGRTILDLLAEHGTEVSADGLLRLERVWPVLDAAVRSSGQIRLPERVERTWRSLGGNTFLDDTALKNADAFLQLLRTIDREEGEVRLSDLLRRLQHLYALPQAQEGSVELVTIHRSKGLEWDVVVVPELDRGSPRSNSRLFEVEELLNGRVILAPIVAKGAEAAALNRWLSGVRARREAAERKRLFYVACTRAKEELHLFGSVTVLRDGAIKANPASLLEAAWSAAEDRVPNQESATLPLRSEEGIVFDLAAAAAPNEGIESAIPFVPVLDRLPLNALPRLHSDPRAGLPKVSAGTHLISEHVRAKGSFSARTLGTAIHTFLEEAAARLKKGTSPLNLLEELPLWATRIKTLLRTSGLPPQVVESFKHTVANALRNTLADPIGQWLLGAGPNARSELALVTRDDQSHHHRIDRIFRGGATPGTPGDTHVWVVDYKTSGYAGEVDDEAAIEAFLFRERTQHAPQLERYSGLLDEDQIRLGLWFPLIGKLTWWEAPPVTQPLGDDIARQFSLFRKATGD